MPTRTNSGQSTTTAAAAIALVMALSIDTASAWVYPEHRQLGLLAVQGLDAEHRAQFDRLWLEARTGSEQQLCPQGADDQQGLAPSCIDWAALTAIAGDHSCSSREMFDTARNADWILVVADVAAQLQADLARIPVTAGAESTLGAKNVISDARRRLASQKVQADRINALRTADIRLQRADPKYATRAGSNNAHFLLPRPTTDMSPRDYADLTLQYGSEISAIGVYASFHLSALQKASRLAHEQLSDGQRAALAQAVLADEAFALHFLQDIYAAGHIAGTWGDVSQRQGTHDFYNQNGLEVFTWAGGSKSIVLMGDAHMRPEDAAIAADTVRVSLGQVLDVASGRPGAPPFPYFPMAPAQPDPLDVCRNNTVPNRPEGMQKVDEDVPLFVATLAHTPVPSLGPGLGAMPRFRSEVGGFSGLSASVDGRIVNGGFVPSQTANGAIAGLDVSFRAGFGLDGVMGPSGDGLVYGSVGFRSEGASTNRFTSSSQGAYGGDIGAAIPARSALSVRVRMPYYLLPGDLLLLSPLYFFKREAYTNMAVTAGNGGLIPWQAGWATAIGRFQFVLGREVGVTFFGITDNDQLLAPGVVQGGPPRIVRFKSTLFDLPILEYRPYRSFAMNQSSSVVFQLFTDVDVPNGGSIDSPPGAPVPHLQTVWSVGLRLVFDWRYYY